MTALTSAIPAPAVRQNGLIRLVRVELLKIRATRLNYGLLGAAAAITALFAVLESARAGSGAPNTPASLSTPAGLSQVMTAGVWALTGERGISSGARYSPRSVW